MNCVILNNQEMTQRTRLQRELYALTEIAKTLTLPLELEELLNAVVQKIGGVIEPAEAGVVMLWDQDRDLFRATAAFGYDLQVLDSLELRLGESITGKVFEAQAGQLLDSPEQVAQAMADLRPSNRQLMARSLGTQTLPRCTLATPISVGQQHFGVLVLETLHGPALFTTRDLPFLQTISDLIALAIDRHRLEVQAETVRQDQQAVQMRSEILAMLSHELRIPLTSIQGYSSALLVDEIEWSEQKRHEILRLIENECVQMQDLLKEILDSSLIDANQLFIQRQPVLLPVLARTVADELQRRTEAHQILVDFPPAFPVLEADPRWLKQVLHNIIDNAIKYSPQGGLIVLRAEERPSDVVIMVADQGIGISPEDLIPLFERYYRVRSAVNLHIPGTGLGLPIARSIVEAHGGRIWAESQAGEGTRIYFSLPKASLE